MAVYMTGDIHGNPSRFYDLKSFCKVHPDAEWFICLGDVGLNYYGEDHPQEMYIKNIADEIPANCSVFMAITSGVLQKQMDINRSMSQRVRFRVR